MELLTPRSKMMMQKTKGHDVIIGEFENKLYTGIAKRNLNAAGINVNILNDSGESLPRSSKAEGVLLLVHEAQVEEAKKILQIKFI